MSFENIKRLQELDFVWDPLKTYWELGFSKLQEFQADHGHCLVPKRYCIAEYKLGSWVANQRSSKNAMGPERRQRLEELGFVWSARGGNY